MPDSYGRPLWMSPRLRCDTSHAAPNVRNVNDPAAKANPMTYQIPVKAILALLGRRLLRFRGIRDRPAGNGRRPSQFYPGSPLERAAALWPRVPAADGPGGTVSTRIGGASARSGTSIARSVAALCSGTVSLMNVPVPVSTDARTFIRTALR